jgi:hypothetical protein
LRAEVTYYYVIAGAAGRGPAFGGREMPYRQDVQCVVEKLEYDFDAKIGVLQLGEHDCTDMSGCIALFKKIDPDVVEIRTFAAKRKDTSYHFDGQQWRSVRAE